MNTHVYVMPEKEQCPYNVLRPRVADGCSTLSTAHKRC